MQSRAHLRYAMISASIAAASTVALYCLGWILALLFARQDYSPVSLSIAESQNRKLHYQSFNARATRETKSNSMGVSIRECWIEHVGIETYNSIFTRRLKVTEQLRMHFALERPLIYDLSARGQPQFFAVYDNGLLDSRNRFSTEFVDGVAQAYSLCLTENQIPSAIAFVDSSGNRVLDFSCTPSE